MKKKIMIVDDEVSVTKLLKYTLERTGQYDILVENSGLKALETLRSQKVDLLILDLNLPDVSGGEISAALKEDPGSAGTPVIFLTGNVSESEAQAGLTIGGHPALAKPINMEGLIEAIEKNIHP